MTNQLARSNKKTEVLFTTDTTTYADKIHGGGFGAYVKMVDRAIISLTGWKPAQVRVKFERLTSTGSFTNRTTNEIVAFDFLEMK